VRDEREGCLAAPDRCLRFVLESKSLPENTLIVRSTRCWQVRPSLGRISVGAVLLVTVYCAYFLIRML
jgi:hypothetical protein